MKIAACIELPDGALAPDPWDETSGAALPLDHIICRDVDGTPHHVREFVWPWTAYHPRKKPSVLHFHYWKTDNKSAVAPSEITAAREARMRELQFFMVLVVYFSANGKENGFGSLENKLKALYRIARFAESRDCTVRDVFEQQPLLDAFIAGLSSGSTTLWVTWIIFLGRLDPELQLGFPLAQPKRLQELKQRAQELRDNSKQHSPLPTRIYAALINNLRAELDDIEAHADRLLDVLARAIQAHNSEPTDSSDSISIGPALLAEFSLAEFIELRGFEPSLVGVSAVVNEVFQVCKLEIHVFSGMRQEEAQHLPFDCMVTERAAHGRKHCLIEGVTTKLEGARVRRTKWVTTEAEGFRAVRLAQRFASVIYKHLGVEPNLGAPLFPSVEYLPWERMRFSNKGIRPTIAHLSRRKLLLERLCPIIEDGDIDELEELDPFRSWREEPAFAVGSRWHLTTHQLRRSLAIYANASGLVRVSSLRRQLQHLTREMSLYYARGSTFCKNFVAEDPDGYKKHIAVEWQDGTEEAKMLAFTLDVLNSTEPLYGGAGNYFQRQRERGTVMSREEVRRQFKAGLLNFNDGPLGGCTKPGTCTSRKGLSLVDVACATDNCKHLVGKHSKIIQVIKLKRAALQHADPNSIDYVMEQEELESLEKVETKWRATLPTCTNAI